MRSFALVLCALIISVPAAAHDWYPWECCSGFDCAPVERAELLPDAGMLVTTKHGTTVIPASLPRRESQDNRMHACMRKGSNGMAPICIFLPPGM